MKLRTHLLFLALATLLPVVLFAVYVAAQLVERERDTFRRGAADRTRAILTAVDLQINGTISSLESLALTRALDVGDLQSFHTIAKRVLSSRDDWRTLQLISVDGKPLVDASTGFGLPLDAPDGASLAPHVVAQTVPAVGHLTPGSGGEFFVPIAVPVVRAGAVRYVLTATVPARTFSEVLTAQRVPERWVCAILDGTHRLVSRTRDGERFVGSMATPDLRAMMDQSDEGWYVGRTLDGQSVNSAFHRSGFSRWTVVMGMPTAELDAGARRSAALMGIGIVAAIVLALGLATLVSRRLAVPLIDLAGAADAIGRGEAVRTRTAPNIDELGRLTGALDEAADAVRTREAQQRAAEQALRAADRQKDDFLAMLGHELRNPLSAIASASQVLRRAHDRPELASNAGDVIDRQVRHMARLIDDLLDVSRVTRGVIEIVREPVDLGAAVKALVDAWRTAGRFAEHDVVASTEPVWVLADASRLDQIVTNLLENALKYTPARGSVRIAVRREGADALFEIIDSGVGLSPELAARMFDLFVQGDRSLDRPQGGLGIGLTLVKRLAELHGASVSGTSPGPGRGARFAVRMPAIDAPDSARASSGASAGDAPRRRVLVVEDNVDAQRSLVDVLTLNGHDVRGTCDGDAALALAEAFRPEIALLDIGLPGMDGYTLARALRERHPGMTLAALTGYGQPEDRERGRAAGFDMYLVKPVEIEEVLGVIAAAAPATSAG